MGKATLISKQLYASLTELKQSGSPVDLSVTTECGGRDEIEIEQVGGCHESAVFELPNGRVGFRADVAVTNQTSRGIDIIDVELHTSLASSQWQWLTPQKIKWREKGLQYVFPGGSRVEFSCEDVINHQLLVRRRLPSKRRLEGWLLGVGGFMPADLRHGQWLDISLVIIGSDHAEHAETIRLWTERLDPAPKRKRPPMSLAQAGKDTTARRREGARSAV
jgi:hypothetical protein